MQLTMQTECVDHKWHLYLVQTAKGALYTGITTDVIRRLTEHESGRGAKALRGRGPLTLVFHRAVGDHAHALRLEYRIKQLTRRRKLDLIDQQPLDINAWLVQ